MPLTPSCRSCHQWRSGLGQIASTIAVVLAVVMTIPMLCLVRPLIAQTAANGSPSPSVVFPGIPSRPDLVTVVPLDTHIPGYPMIIAEVDGRRGTFLLDTGAPWVRLNGQYVRPSPTGGLDTVLAGSPPGDAEPSGIHTVRIGTVSAPVATTLGFAGPPPTTRITANFDGTRLGNLGESALLPFETIFDYARHRLVVIRLDSAGHPLATISAYTPVVTIPMVPGVDEQHWAVEVSVDTVHRRMYFDTGMSTNIINREMRDAAPTHFTAQENVDSVLADISKRGGSENVSVDEMPLWVVDHLVVGGHPFQAVPVRDEEHSFPDILGQPFLSQYGAVGFNFHTHRLTLYRAAS